MKSVRLLFIFIPILLFGCTNEFKSFENELLSIDENILERDLIIIPKEGCTGCILNVTYYAEQNIDSINKNVLFTVIQDLKLFRLKVDSAFLSHDQVFIDEKNVIKSRNIGIYPILVETDDGKIISVSEFSVPN
ncbi:hypothetical protein [Marivirga sp.]|uniref:hypothetical protein n=1 Tax=Marivirga sp. TaxID=2018662 RepID=UPI002D7F388C|nr:hypothetical protein [Marivirga sp.]HET8861102.1 hypothetical protein [Marivirga sp.]